mgnify:CR=1 FL=1
MWKHLEPGLKKIHYMLFDFFFVVVFCVEAVKFIGWLLK